MVDVAVVFVPQKIFSGPRCPQGHVCWHSNFGIKKLAVEMVWKKNSGEFLPALMVTASVCCAGRVVCVGTSEMCLWTRISSVQWMVS